MEDIIDTLKNSCCKISKLMNETEPFNLSKLTNDNNKSGDDVKKLDILSNDILKDDLSQCKNIRVIGSEEEDEMIYTENKEAKYMICFDPLDGSSNIDSNITVGTIFGIYDLERGLKDGNSIVCSGYCLYGSSTQFIIAEDTVKIYMLKNNKFNLIDSNFKMKEKGNIYSINESYKNRWIDKRNNNLVNILIDENYTSRWVGSMVSDCHRTLIKGGIFAYPRNSKDMEGKIRLLYEAYPFCYLFKIAGGKSSNGEKDILDIEFPKDIHKKTPIYIGSNYEINLLNNLQ